MRPSPEIITYLATAACFGFGFYAVAWLIFAAFKYADTTNDRTDQPAEGDPDFTGATWNREDLTAWGDVPALPENNLLHSAPLAGGVQRDHV
jgi:hypothetical protein